MAQVFENADLTAAADFGGAFNVTTSGDLLTMNVSLVTFGELIYTWNINTGVLQTWYFHISVANLYEGTLRIEQVSSDGNDGGNLFDNAPLPIYSVLIGLLAVPVIRKKFKA